MHEIQNGNYCKPFENTLAFTKKEYDAEISICDENTPERLGRKCFLIASLELKRTKWRCILFALHQGISNDGLATVRLEYSAVLERTFKEVPVNMSSKSCTHLTKSMPVGNQSELINPWSIKEKEMNISKRTDCFCINQKHKNVSWYQNMPVGVNEITKWTKQLDINKGKIWISNLEITAAVAWPAR